GQMQLHRGDAADVRDPDLYLHGKDLGVVHFYLLVVGKQRSTLTGVGKELVHFLGRLADHELSPKAECHVSASPSGGPQPGCFSGCFDSRCTGMCSRLLLSGFLHRWDGDGGPATRWRPSGNPECSTRIADHDFPQTPAAAG